MKNNKYYIHSFKLLAAVAFLLLQVSALYAQRPFNVYVFSNMYNANVQKTINQSSTFKDIKIIYKSGFDPQNTGDINVDAIKRRVAQLFPNANDAGLLCLDIENKQYANLRGAPVNSADYQTAVQLFVNAVRAAKALRPNVKVGLYGVPFKIGNKDVPWNGNDRLNAVLKECDVIFPSLYIYYPGKQKGRNFNDNFLKQNLKTALAYGSNLSKPVIPFVWYQVHPGNKVFGGEAISGDELKEYVQTIRNYQSNNNGVDGIVWWESAKGVQKKNAKVPFAAARAAVTTDDTSSGDRSQMFMNYMRDIGVN